MSNIVANVLDEHDALTDKAGLVRRAVPHVGRYLEGRDFGAVLHHGAYELIGVHLDLLRAIDRSRSTVFLLPCEPGSRVTEYAESFANRYLLRDGTKLTRLEDTGRGLLGDRLGALYDEQATVNAGDSRQVQLLHAQGPTRGRERGGMPASSQPNRRRNHRFVFPRPLRGFSLDGMFYPEHSEQFIPATW